MFEEATGSAYDDSFFSNVTNSNFYKELVALRVNRNDGLINDRGFRHVKNEGDISGFSYAFWLIREK